MQQLTPQQAAKKIRTYCAYQERCHEEVKQKLYSYGIYGDDIDLIMVGLIEENYLNEERFARLFAGGKFRMKGWGRVKIKQELKMKKVGDYIIRLAMTEIEEEDYLSELQKQAEKKWASLKGRALEKAAKTTRFLMQKGFELPLIQDVVATLQHKQ